MCCHSVVKWHEVAPNFVMVDCVREREGEGGGGGGSFVLFSAIEHV